MIIDDVEKRATAGNELAKRLAAEWVYPVEMIFLTPDGQVAGKLNSYKDFPSVHPDVSSPPDRPYRTVDAEASHSERFLEFLDRHFGKK